MCGLYGCVLVRVGIGSVLGLVGCCSVVVVVFV